MGEIQLCRGLAGEFRTPFRYRTSHSLEALAHGCRCLEYDLGDGGGFLSSEIRIMQ